MNKEDISTLTDDQLVQHLKKLRWDDLAKEASLLAPEKLAYVVKEIENEGGDKAAQTICVLFLGAKTKEQIEEMGKVLDTRYTLRIIHEAIKIEPAQMWKISSLLIGLTHRVFLKVLTEASPKELEIIQHQALREPVQHHLTLFVHEADQEINSLVDEATELRVEIGVTDPKGMNAKDLDHFLSEIERLKKQAAILVERIGRSLQLAWNTNRPDLVAKLTHSKETALRFIHRVAGDRDKWSGIFEVFHNKLNQVYGDPEETEGCKNDEPAVEAMTKLGLWYLSDYWSVGLLPQIKEEDDLKLEQKREHILELLEKNLEEMNLSTVGDFKKAFLFSKNLLADYITAFNKSKKT